MKEVLAMLDITRLEEGEISDDTVIVANIEEPQDMVNRLVDTERSMTWK